MVAPSETIAQALTQIADNQRRLQTQYQNIYARPGETRAPRRLMSDVGFLSSRQYVYLNANQRNFYYNDDEGPRDILQIIIVGYGAAADYRRLTSSRPSDRLVHQIGASTGGVAPHPEDDRYLISGALNDAFYSEAKQQAAIQGVTGRQGPSPHFIINRKGDVAVGPSVDASTTVIPDFADSGVFIAIETALMILREDHTQRRFDRILEMPIPPVQYTQLAVMVNKLLVALGSAFPRTFTSNLTAEQAGFSYRLLSAPERVSPANFSATTPVQPVTNPRISYANMTPTVFFNAVREQGPFNLATDIWRPFAEPTPAAGREEVRTAVGQVSTAGEEAALMGNYVTIAAGDRSTEMQTVIRRQVFVQRQRVAQQDAETTSNQAAEAATSSLSNTLPNEQVLQTEPHSYDFTTGEWGTPDPVLGTRNV